LPRHSASIGTSTWVVAALALGLTGCDRVFQLLEVTDTGVSDATDAITSDGGGDAPDASTTPCFSDDFSAPALDESKWTVQDSPTATVAQSSGVLVFSLGQATGVNYALVTTEPRDLTNDAVSVEVVAAPSSNTEAELGISVQIDSNNRYQLFITGTSLVMRYSTAEGNQDTSAPYSATHRFLRLRQLGETMFWESSTDRLLWIVRRMATAVVPVTNVRAVVFAGTYQQEPEPPGQPAVDNFLIECLP